MLTFFFFFRWSRVIPCFSLTSQKIISEATRRTIKQAENEDCVGVDLEHVERILPQLVSIFEVKIIPNINDDNFFFCYYVALKNGDLIQKWSTLFVLLKKYTLCSDRNIGSNILFLCYK